MVASEFNVHPDHLADLDSPYVGNYAITHKLTMEDYGVPHVDCAQLVDRPGRLRSPSTGC